LTGWPATARSWFEVSSSPSFPCRERREKEAQQQRQGDREGRQVKAGRNSGNPLIKGGLQNSGNPIRPCTFIDGDSDGKSSKGGDAVSCAAQRHSCTVSWLPTETKSSISLPSLLAFPYCCRRILSSDPVSAESSLAFSRPGVGRLDNGQCGKRCRRGSCKHCMPGSDLFRCIFVSS
jgi:hypothetical protein